MSFFNNLEDSPADPIIGLNSAFGLDKRDFKTNLGIGTYREEDLIMRSLPTVKKVAIDIANQIQNFDYSPISGDKEFCDLLLQHIMGKDRLRENVNNICVTQTIGGTGALYLAGKLLSLCNKDTVVSIPSPTWANHNHLFTSSGLNVSSHKYLDLKKNIVDFDNLLTDIRKLPNRSAVLLQTCCHNPSGIDLNKNQWLELSSLMKDKKLIPVFDTPYLGFANGIEKDREALEAFIDSEQEIIIAYSCSKTFGLYGERTGALIILSKNKERIGKKLERIIRATYSNPNSFGAKIVKKILSNKSHHDNWLNDLEKMRNRIKSTRNELTLLLKEYGFGERFDYIGNGLGMFALLGISINDVLNLREKYGFYLTDSSRINIAGLNKERCYIFSEALSKIIS